MNARHPDDDALIACALGEIDPSRRQALDGHLAACPECGAAIRALRAALAGFRRSAHPDAPARVLVNLIEAQAAAGTAREARPWGRAPLPAAAALTILAAFFLSGFWAGQRVPVAARPTGSASAPARLATLPPAPRVEFTATPPMELRFAANNETIEAWMQDRTGGRDSL